MTSLLALSSARLIRLLKRDGWVLQRKVRHGASFTKAVGGETLVTVIPLRRRSIAKGTLMAILGPQQTRLGKRGLQRLLSGD